MYAEMGKHLAEEGYRMRSSEQPEPEYYHTARETAEKELAAK